MANRLNQTTVLPARGLSYLGIRICHSAGARFGLRQSALFRTPYGSDLRLEHRALCGSLRGGTELELALIELIDNLTHSCLIQSGPKRSEVLGLVCWSRPGKLRAAS